ncbi:MAG: M20/M25/M40 family metallo-hydrolase [Nannocystaceae bacterium]
MARPRLRRALAVALALAAALALGLVVRALTLPSRQVPPASFEAPAIDEARAIEHLAAAIRLPTIAGSDGRGEDFRALHELLIRAYPCFHRVTRREAIGEYGLLHTWPGVDEAAAPVLLIAHLDVVPVADPSVSAAPALRRRGRGGAIWGRGSIDDKGGLIALLEAAEALCLAEFRPRRPLLFALGDDEEVGGAGARAIAEALRAREIRPIVALDEGMVIVDSAVPGLERPLAPIGVSEKGIVTLRLAVSESGGHASMPPPQTAAGLLAAALVRLEADPFPLALRAPTRDLFEAVAPELGLGRRGIFGTLWLFEGLITRTMVAADRTRALLHTTTAITILEAGVAANVLPTRAEALVNLRIHPGETVASTIARVQAVIDDPRVEVTIDDTEPMSEPPPIARADGPGFAAIAAAVRGAIPDAVVAPSLAVATSDSRHYQGIVGDIYRLRPIHLSAEEIAAIHGIDERLPVAEFVREIRIDAAILRGLAEIPD